MVAAGTAVAAGIAEISSVTDEAELTGLREHGAI
jgi:hypothetical protein